MHARILIIVKQQVKRTVYAVEKNDYSAEKETSTVS